MAMSGPGTHGNRIGGRWGSFGSFVDRREPGSLLLRLRGMSIFSHRLFASLVCCLVLGACGGQTIAESASLSNVGSDAGDSDSLAGVGAAVEVGNDPANSFGEEARCDRSPSPLGDFTTEVTPEQVMAFGEELRSAAGPSFTGMSWRSSASVEVYGTAPNAPVELLDLGARREIEIVYRQVLATSADLDETIDWLGQHMRSTALDVRTAYVDVTCGAVVVIVGDENSQAVLEERAGEAGRRPFLAVVVDPSYVATFRESVPPTSGSSAQTDDCPLIRGVALDASEYLGLVEEQAETQASEAGLILIVECRDGEIIPGPRPANIDHSRLWISIDSGVITSAYRV